MSIGAYHEDKLICTVSVLKTYISRTSELKTTSLSHSVRGKLLSRPLIISDSKDKQGLFFELTHERIAKINLGILRKCGVLIFTSHSVRGASSSKVVNLGGDLQAVLARARWASAKTFRKHSFKSKSISSIPSPSGN